MRLSKKAMAVLMGLTLTTGIGSTAFAATADSFTDVPKDHWSYEALDYLAKEGVIDGMGNSTFQGGRTMTRYEMASIVAKAMQKGGTNFGDKAVLDKLANEYSGEIDTLKRQVNANTKDIKDLQEKTDKFKVWGMVRVQAGDDNGLVSNRSNVNNNNQPNGTYNNRFYMDLEGQMKVNDHAVARFTVEKNAHYRDSEYATKTVYHTFKTSDKNQPTLTVPVKVPMSGIDKDSIFGDDNHNGSISNIWVELQLGPKHDWYTNIGRKWNGIGMQNLMLGGQVDGIATYHPIEHGHGWWLSAQYWKPSADWTEYSINDNYTLNAWPVDKKGNWVDLTTATGKANFDHYSSNYEKGDPVTAYSRRAPVVGTLNFWGPLGKYMDLNLAWSHLVSHQLDSNQYNTGYWSGAKNFYGVDLKVRPIKDVAITGSYVKSDAKKSSWKSWANGGQADRDVMVKIEYKGTDLNKVKSWGVYAKYANLGCVADLGHDDEWATREPTFVNGIKGWYYGFKMVPWKNCEWETMWAPHLTENYNQTGKDYSRHILRTWVDFHF